MVSVNHYRVKVTLMCVLFSSPAGSFSGDANGLSSSAGPACLTSPRTHNHGQAFCSTASTVQQVSAEVTVTKTK